MRRLSLWKRALLLGIGLNLLIASLGSAATPQTEVGSEEERLRRPKKLEPPPRLPPGVELPLEEPTPVPPLAAPTLQVTRIALEGSTLLPDEELKKLVSPIIGRTVALSELQEVTQAVTRWYRGRGYVTSRAVIPAQEVKDGLVRIRVIEGKVGQLKVEGNRYFSTSLLTRQMKISSGELLWLPRLEGALSRLNAHPDRKVKLILVPGAEAGTTDLVLQVTDRRPIHSNYGVDTLGTKATGQIRQSLLVAHGNLTGQDDQMVIRGLITEFGGLKGGTFSYLRPLTPAGVTATLDVSGILSSVGGDSKFLLARGDAVTVSPGLIVPLFRRSRLEWEGVAGFDVKRIRTRLDEVTSSKDDLRVFHVGTNLLQQDTNGQSLVTQELRVGIGSLFGGSHPEDPAASRAKAGGSFVRWLLNLVRVQQGPWGTSLILRVAAHVTTKRLVPAEQFRLGGFETVRGYPEGEFLADTGYQTAVELRAPFDRFFPFGAGSTTLLRRVRRSLLLVVF